MEKLTGQDQDIIRKLKSLLKDATPKHDQMVKWCEDNERFYLGQQWDKDKSSMFNNEIVENYIFMAVETVVPIITERQPILEAYYADPRDESVNQADKTEKILKFQCRRLNWDLIAPQIVRQMFLYRFCAVKPFWNLYDNDIDLEIVSYKNLYLDPNASKTKDLEYVIYKTPRTLKYLYENFDQKKVKELEDLYKAETNKEGDELNKSQFEVCEFWGFVKEETKKGASYDIRVITFVKDIVLENKKNPFWDFEGKLEQGQEQVDPEMAELLGEDLSEKTKKYNHLSKQCIPIVIFDTLNKGDDLFSPTSCVEQVKKIQVAINQMRAQMIDYTSKMCNGAWIIDEESGVDPDTITNDNGAIYVKNQGTEMRRDQPLPMPNALPQLTEQLLRAFDNIFGTHDITRGERTGQKTATESTLLKDADQGRIALMIRNFNAGMVELGNWWIQLMKLFYTEPHYISILGEEKAREFLVMTQDDFQDGLEIVIQAGSNTPIDRYAQRAEATDLAKAKLMTPMKLYNLRRDLFDNPEDESISLAQYQMGQPYQPKLLQQLQEQQQAQQIPPDLAETPTLLGNSLQEQMPPDLEPSLLDNEE